MNGTCDYRSLSADTFYPGRQAIDHYGRCREDIALFARWALSATAFLFPGREFSRTEKGRDPVKRDFGLRQPY